VALPAFVALAALPAVLPEQYPAVPAYVAFVALAALPDVFAALFGISPDTSARKEGAPDPDVGPAKTKLFDVEVRPVPPDETARAVPRVREDAATVFDPEIGP
jgi:hypothetical protein